MLKEDHLSDQVVEAIEQHYDVQLGHQGEQGLTFFGFHLDSREIADLKHQWPQEDEYSWHLEAEYGHALAYLTHLLHRPDGQWDQNDQA